MVTSKILNPERLKKIKGIKKHLLRGWHAHHFQVPLLLLFNFKVKRAL